MKNIKWIQFLEWTKKKESHFTWIKELNEFGFMPWMAYCKREEERIGNEPGRHTEVRSRGKNCCLWVNDVGERIPKQECFK